MAQSPLAHQRMKSPGGLARPNSRGTSPVMQGRKGFFQQGSRSPFGSGASAGGMEGGRAADQRDFSAAFEPCLVSHLYASNRVLFLSIDSGYDERLDPLADLGEVS